MNSQGSPQPQSASSGIMGGNITSNRSYDGHHLFEVLGEAVSNTTAYLPVDI